MLVRASLLWLVIGLLWACGAHPSHVRPSLEAKDELLSERPALQMYLVLTHDRSAMQRPEDVQEMWSAVHGERQDFEKIRGRVRWASANYAIDIELDFASLPHESLPSARLRPMLRKLSEAQRSSAEAAPLAISVRSQSKTLPYGEQIRLVGAAVLHIAETYNGVVVDLMARRAWTTTAWRAELSAAELSSKQTRLVIARKGRNTVRLRSRGNLKFGLPDLELDAPADRLRGAQDRLAAAQRRLMSTGKVGTPTGACQGKGYDGLCLRLTEE